MDPVTLILTALAAGAAAALKGVATAVIQDGYAGLKALVVKKFADKPLAKEMVEEYAKDPETYQKPMEKNLKEAKADQDGELVKAAEKLLEALKAQPGGSELINQTINISGQAKVGKVYQIGTVEGKLPE
jgi:hypothetical protein